MTCVANAIGVRTHGQSICGGSHWQGLHKQVQGMIASSGPWSKSRQFLLPRVLVCTDAGTVIMPSTERP